MDSWLFITQFGNSSLLLALAILLGAALWRYESPQAAWLWARALLFCIIALVVLKLLFLSYGYRWYGRLESPSGHAGLSLMVYGGAAAVLIGQSSRLSHRVSVLIALIPLSLALAIGLSRKLIGAHSVAEVMLGSLIGLAGLIMFMGPYRALSHPPMHLGRIGGLGALITVILLGTSFSPENFIWRTAMRIKSELRNQEAPTRPPSPPLPGARHDPG